MYQKEEKVFNLPNSLEFKIISRRQPVKYELEILPNGLIICDIKIINLFNTYDDFVKCKALIDTGSEFTILCHSIFSLFKTENDKREPIKISTLNGLPSEEFLYPLQIQITDNNWRGIQNRIVVKDLSKREEYQAIIGMDILRNFELIYKGTQGLAYLLDY
jgi:hypothetical protein